MATATKWISSILCPPDAFALGRLVGDLSDPSDSFQDTSRSKECPDGPEPDSEDHQAKNFHFDNSAGHNHGFSLALTTILSSSLSVEVNDVSTIEADTITTRKLRNTAKYFEKACQNEDVQEWLEGQWRGKQKAYIVTGMITLFNAHVKLSQKRVLDTKQAFTIAGSTVLLAASQGTIPTLGGIESLLDSEAAASMGTAKRTASGFMFPGETIFAVQYKRVEFSRFRKPSPKTMNLSSRSKWKEYCGNRGEDSDTYSEDEDGLDVEDIDAGFVSLQAMVGDDIDLDDLGDFRSCEDYSWDANGEIWCIS